MHSVSCYEQAFEPYRDEVAAIATRLDNGEQPRQVRGYINSGWDFDVFRLKDARLVAKLPHTNESNAPEEVVRTVMQTLARVAGRPGLEQLVGGSLHYPTALLCAYAPSQNACDTPEAQLRGIQPQYFARLFSNLQFLQNEGLFLDPGIGNVRYGRTQGFTLIDLLDETGYARQVPGEDNEQSFGDKVIALGTTMLFHTGSSEVPLLGKLYRDACHELVGPDMAMALECEWEDAYRFRVA
ncbi:MAG TPA: hypothetical protein VJR27_00745 [Candidatus Saccharimonadales bacterium]|nr:hypothetical protein [Candidatus Saccharimonadales bacterium]